MNRSPRPLLPVLAVALALALAVAGCSSDGGSEGAPPTSDRSSTTTVDGTDTTTTPPPTTTSATATTAPPTTAPATGCTAGDAAPPPGSRTGRVPDVDGDGRADIGWVSAPDPQTGETTVGIQTAAGGGATFPFESASPVERTMLVVDADHHGPIEVLLDDGRSVQLVAFSDCTIAPIRNPQGQPYLFDLHRLRGNGTGVGCRGTGSDRRLVGLDHEPAAADGTVAWTSTDIDLDGLSASNGTAHHGTFHAPEDAAAIELLDGVACGDRTMQADGIRGPR
ncbi:MAG TPA: hypothetical protein P5193_16195 [Microthrixaceae bacterium]|nr:hypothetical protein [Microthrixaceae bacterium]